MECDADKFFQTCVSRYDALSLFLFHAFSPLSIPIGGQFWMPSLAVSRLIQLPAQPVASGRLTCRICL